MFRAELGNGDRERAIALLERLKERYVCASKERNWGLDLLLLDTFPKRCITGYEASCSTTRWHLGASRRSPSRLLLLRLDPCSFTRPQHLLIRITAPCTRSLITHSPVLSCIINTPFRKTRTNPPTC